MDCRLKKSIISMINFLNSIICHGYVRKCVFFHNSQWIKGINGYRGTMHANYSQRVQKNLIREKGNDKGFVAKC